MSNNWTKAKAIQQQLTQEQRRIQGLRHVLDGISGALTGAPLLRHIVAGTLELFEATSATMWFVDARGSMAGVVPVEAQGSPILGDELALEVLHTRQSLLLSGSILVVPLWWDGRINAVLGVSDASADRFDNDDLQTLALFAQYTTVALANARLLEGEWRRAVRSGIINRISRQIAESLSLQTIFQTAVEAIHSQLDLAHVSAGIVDPEDPELLALLAHAGIYEVQMSPGYRQSIHVGLVGAAMRARQRLLVANPLDDPRFLQGLDNAPLQAALVLPLAVGERLLGVLNIESTRPIDDEEADAIEQIADQLAVAMDRAALFERMQRALEESRLLYETSQRMSTALTEDAVIESYLEYVARSHHYICGVVLYDFLKESQQVGRRLWGHWTPSRGIVRDEWHMPYVPHADTMLLDAEQTLIIADVVDDPRVFVGLREYMAQEQWRSLAIIPLMVRGQRIGIIWLAHPSVYHWKEDELQPYQSTSALLATAIDHRRQLVRLTEQHHELAVLEERRRLARELHDSVTQSLFSMSLLAQAIPDLWEIDPTEARTYLAQIRDMTRGALSEMRTLLFALRPAALAEQGLVQAIRDYATAFAERTNLPVAVTTTGEIVLPADVEQALFRIVQEALANAARHAQPHSVHVTLRGGTSLQLFIIDDGLGFDVSDVGGGRFGLESMRERAASINAQLQIRSAPGQGTAIELSWSQSV